MTAQARQQLAETQALAQQNAAVDTTDEVIAELRANPVAGPAPAGAEPAAEPEGP